MTAAELANGAIFQLASDAMVLVGDDATILAANAAAERMFGASASKLVEAQATDVAVAGEGDGSGIQTLLGERFRNRDYYVMLADGVRHDIECSVTPNVTEGAHLVIIRDITERKRLEASLRASDELFARTLLNAPAAITVTSTETGKFILVNEAFLRLTGYWRAEVIGQSAVDLRLWRDPSERDEVAKQLSMAPYSGSVRATFRAKAGNLLRGLCAAQMAEIGGRPCVITVVIEDVTA